jgi:hypothetical protein
MSVMLREYHGGSTAGKPPTRPMALAAKTIDRSGARTRQGRRLSALPLDKTVWSRRGPSLLGLLPPLATVFHVERRARVAPERSGRSPVSSPLPLAETPCFTCTLGAARP